jgi:hypothetical protein
MTNNPKNKLSRVATWAIIAVFLLPLLAAGLLYLTRDHWELGTKQHGTLLNPPIQLSLLPFKYEPSSWRLLLVLPECMDPSCELLLAKIDSIHQATGKDYPRVITSLFTESETADEALLKKFKAIHWFTLPKDNSLQFSIYIADPQGYLILQYPLDVQAQDILEDLRHLLRNSQIG